MVVNCEKCGSTLRVDESKIPDAGVIARCTICSHRFHLKKEQNIADSPVRSTSGTAGETASTKPAPEQKKSAERSDTPPLTGHAAPKKEEISPRPAVPSPTSAVNTQASAGSNWDFSSFFADEGKEEPAPDETMNAVTAAGSTVDGGTSGRQELDEMPYEVQEISEEDEIATGSSAYTEVSPENTPFTKSPEQQSTARGLGENQGSARLVDAQERATEGSQAPSDVFGKSANSATPSDFERIVSNPAIETQTGNPARQPVQEIITDDQKGRQMVLQQPGREIATLLDQSGLSDDYVVRMVQEVCEATRYVEGVEKPDWPIRLQGLDILCKIKGLYPTEKKNDPANRQVQIVTGINM